MESLPNICLQVFMGMEGWKVGINGGRSLLDSGGWILDAGGWILDAGSLVRVSDYWVASLKP